MAEEEARGSGYELCWCLRRVGGSQERLLLQEGEEVTLGRGIGVSYQLVSKDSPLMISRVHCVLRQNGEGRWTLTDNGSLNGVWLDKERVEPHKPYVLAQDSCVQLGVPLANVDTAEFEYEVVQENLVEIQKFLVRPQPGKSKQPRSKRKLTCEDAEASGAEGTSSMSKAKIPRPLREAEEADPPVDPELSRQPTVKVFPEGLESYEDIATKVGAMTASQRQDFYNSHLAQLRQLTAEARRIYSMFQEAKSSVQEPGKDVSQDSEYQMMRKELLQSLSPLKRATQKHKEIESRMRLDRGLTEGIAEAFQEVSVLIEEVEAPDSQHDVQLRLTQEEEERKAEAQKEEVLQHMSDVLDNELQCIICSEHFIEAVTLNCAHSFCSYCIQSWRKRKEECPICRQEIKSQTRSLVLDNCINSMVDKLSADMRERRLALIKERKDLVLEETPVSPYSDSFSDVSPLSISDDSEDLDSDTEIDDLSFSDDLLDLDSEDDDDEMFILL